MKLGIQLLFLLVLLGVLSAQCSLLSSCRDCANSGCSWCSPLHRCEERNGTLSTCEQIASRMFSLGRPETHSGNWHFDATKNLVCDIGTLRVETAERCPNFNISVTQHPSTTSNMNNFGTRVVLGFNLEFNNATLNVSDVVPSVYFIQVPNSYKMPAPAFGSLRKIFSGWFPEYPLLYSYSVSAQLPYDIITTERYSWYVLFNELEIIGEFGQYQLGYAVGVQQNGNVTCAYVPAPSVIQHSSSFTAHLDILFYAQLVVFVLSLVAGFIIVVFSRKNMGQAFTELRETSKMGSAPDAMADRVRGSDNVFQEIMNGLSATKQEMINRAGGASYFYMGMRCNFLLFSILAMILFPLPLLLLSILNRSQQPYFLDYAVITHGAIGNDGLNSLFILGVVIAMVVLPIMFSFFRVEANRLSKTLIAQEPEKKYMTVVQVSGISSSTDQDIFRQYFESTYGKESILSAVVILELSKFKQVYEQKQELLERAKKNKIGWWTNFWCYKLRCRTVRDEIASLERKLQMMKKPGGVKSSQIGYVTFTKLSTANRCLNDSRKNKNNWKYSLAHDHKDIIWDNFEVTRGMRGLRKILVRAAVLLPFFLAILTLNVLTGFVDAALDFFTHDINDAVYLFMTKKFPYLAGTTTILNQRLSVANVLTSIIKKIVDSAPMIVMLFNSIVIPFVIRKAVSLERQISKSTEKKIFIIQLIPFLAASTLLVPYFFSFVVSYTILYWAGEAPFNNLLHFSNTASVSMLMYTISLCTLQRAIPILDFIGKRFLSAICCCCCCCCPAKRRQKRPTFNYEQNYAEIFVNGLFIVFFGPINPIVIILLVAYNLVSFFLDKWMILFVYKRTEETSGYHLRVLNTSIIILLLIYPFYGAFILQGFWMFALPYFPIAMLLNILIGIIGINIWNSTRKMTPQYVLSPDGNLLDQAPRKSFLRKRGFGSQNHMETSFLKYQLVSHDMVQEQFSDLKIASGSESSQHDNEDAAPNADDMLAIREISDKYKHPLQELYYKQS